MIVQVWIVMNRDKQVQDLDRVDLVSIHLLMHFGELLEEKVPQEVNNKVPILRMFSKILSHSSQWVMIKGHSSNSNKQILNKQQEPDKQKAKIYM